MSTAPSKPGWYPDPDGGPKQRYWDGEQWLKAPPSPKLEQRREWAVRFAEIPNPEEQQEK